MAAYLNRTISMVTGNGGNADNSKSSSSQQQQNKSLNYDPLMSENRTMHINSDKSPLQIFVRAKKKINDIYVEIEEYVNETTQFING